jgi:uncharacterized repeat protein (TIGR01451 family)
MAFSTVKSVDKPSDQYYVKGDQIIFTITLTHTNGGADSGLEIDDVIPSQVSIISATAIVGIGDTPTISGQTVKATNITVTPSGTNSKYQLQIVGVIN